MTRVKPLCIAQISDFHFTRVTLNPLRLLSKRFLGLSNWFFFRKNELSAEQVAMIPPLLRSRKAELVLLGGDFTSTALPSEFQDAKQWIDQLDAPWIAVAGNHDCYTYRAFRNKHLYQAIQNPKKANLFDLARDGIEARQIRDGWWVIALDTARATNLYSSRGLFSEQLQENLQAALDTIPQNSSILMLNHYPFFQHDSYRRTLKRSEELLKIVKSDCRIKLYLHGHTHRHTIANLQPSNLPIILDSGCAALQKHGSWNLLTIDDHGIDIEVYQWQNQWTITQKKRFEWTR